MVLFFSLSSEKLKFQTRGLLRKGKFEIDQKTYNLLI